MSDEVLLERRREINRRAATKSRRKQREKAVSVKQKYHEELSHNTKLNYENTVLLKERDLLREQLRDHQKICSNPGSLPKPTVTPVYVSSSDSSDEADLMGYSCESLDGNESDVSGIYPEQTIRRNKDVVASSSIANSSFETITEDRPIGNFVGLKRIAEEACILNEGEEAQEAFNFRLKKISPSGQTFLRSKSCPYPNSQATESIPSEQPSGSLASGLNSSTSSLTSSNSYMLESWPLSAAFGAEREYFDILCSADDNFHAFAENTCHDSSEIQQFNHSSLSCRNLEEGIKDRLKINSSEDKEEFKIGSSMDDSSLDSLIQKSEKRPVTKSDEREIGEIERYLKDCESETGTNFSCEMNEASIKYDNFSELDTGTKSQNSYLDYLLHENEFSGDIFNETLNIDDIFMEPISQVSRMYETRLGGCETVTNPINDETLCIDSSELELRGRGLPLAESAESNDAIYDPDIIGCFSSSFGKNYKLLQASSDASTDSCNFVSKVKGFVDKPKSIESHTLLQKMEDCSSKSIISDISPEPNFRKKLVHFSESASNMREMERYEDDYETDRMKKLLIGHSTTELSDRTHWQLSAKEQLVGRTHEQLVGRTKVAPIVNSILSDSRQMANECKRRHSSTSSIHEKEKYVRFSPSTYITHPMRSTQEMAEPSLSFNYSADEYNIDNYWPFHSNELNEMPPMGENRTNDTNFRSKSLDTLFKLTPSYEAPADSKEFANKFQSSVGIDNKDITDDRFIAKTITMPNVAQNDETSIHSHPLGGRGSRSSAYTSQFYHGTDHGADRLLQPPGYDFNFRQTSSNSNDGRHIFDRKLITEKTNLNRRRIVRQNSSETISNPSIPSSVVTYIPELHDSMMWHQPLHSKHRTYDSMTQVAGSSQNMSQFSPDTGIEGMSNRYDPMMQGSRLLPTDDTETDEIHATKGLQFNRSHVLGTATNEPRRIARGIIEQHHARGYCRSDPSIFPSSLMHAEDEHESLKSIIAGRRMLLRGLDESITSADKMVPKEWESLQYNTYKNHPEKGLLNAYTFKQSAPRTNRKSFSTRRIPEMHTHKTHISKLPVTKLSKSFSPYESIPEMETALSDKSHHDPSYPSGSDNSQTYDPYYTWSPSTARREMGSSLHPSRSDFDYFSDRSMVPTCTGSMDLDDLNYLSTNEPLSDFPNSDLVNR